jgi:hypothetical protein
MNRTFASAARWDSLLEGSPVPKSLRLNPTCTTNRDAISKRSAAFQRRWLQPPRSTVRYHLKSTAAEPLAFVGVLQQCEYRLRQILGRVRDPDSIAVLSPQSLGAYGVGNHLHASAIASKTCRGVPPAHSYSLTEPLSGSCAIAAGGCGTPRPAPPQRWPRWRRRKCICQAARANGAE